MQNPQIISNLRKLAKIIESYCIERDKNQLRDAGYFNPLHFLKTDENGLSTILAFLLDPKEKHGQQDLFLNSFLKSIKKPEFLAYDKIIVRTEMPTFEDLRRHDIFIEGWIKDKRQWIVSIENKLRWASDQPAQMKDYAKDLEKYNVPFCLLYLSVFGDMPGENSITKEEWKYLGEQAKLLSAQHLIEWLDKTPIVAPRIMQFSEDIKNFLREDIMGIDQNSNKLLEQIILEKDLLGASISIIEQQDLIYEKLITKLENQLNELFEKNFPKLKEKKWRVYSNRSYKKNYFGFFYDTYENKPDKTTWGVGIEFGEPFFKKSYFGVWAHKKRIESKNYELLSEKFNPQETGFKQEANWLKWKYCDHNLRNWNAETWQGVLDGTLAKQIFELLEPFAQIAEDNIEQLNF
ncbi:PD-(D/E)XK nuclease family protein [Caviibacterium pharyngocola]|uniref:PD-(D/E)XK nuclease family protein n=1 Tax=Caviibacterium pharyngocola TaxID=28159 RepID=A0A2M8RX20_9PAST|nr:PD-(D/E)XK nuclease family protein [Caviibacterium pharyngocola]PJG83433.1 hypothetical protein CVP04_04730 [Caviibacterium pharyngocola]